MTDPNPKVQTMTDPNPNPAPEVTDEQLKGWIGEVVDEKLSGFESRLSEKFSALDNVGSMFEGFKNEIFESLKDRPSSGGSSDFDKGGFLKEIESLIDSKLQGITTSGGNSGGSSERKPGWLGRFLAGNAG